MADLFTLTPGAMSGDDPISEAHARLTAGLEAILAEGATDLTPAQWAGIYSLQQAVQLMAAEARPRAPDAAVAADPDASSSPASSSELSAAFWEIANLASAAVELEPMLDDGRAAVPVLAVLRQIGILADHQRARLGAVQARGDAMAWLWNMQEGARHG